MTARGAVDGEVDRRRMLAIDAWRKTEFAEDAMPRYLIRCDGDRDPCRMAMGARVASHFGYETDGALGEIGTRGT